MKWRGRCVRNLSCQQAHDRPDFRHQLSGPGRSDGSCRLNFIFKEQIWQQDTIHRKRSIQLRGNSVAGSVEGRIYTGRGFARNVQSSRPVSVEQPGAVADDCQSRSFLTGLDVSTME